MKKSTIIIWSIVIYLAMCFLELFICNMPLHFGANGYTVLEKGLFVVIAMLSGVAIFFLLKNKSIKYFLINTIIMCVVFAVLDLLIGVRQWIGIFTGNETIVLGVNFLGDDLWVSHDIGCFVGVVVTIIGIILGKIKRSR